MPSFKLTHIMLLFVWLVAVVNAQEITFYADAYVPQASDGVIIPTPQEQTPLPGTFSLNADTSVLLLSDTPTLRRATEDLLRRIEQQFKLQLVITTPADASTLPQDNRIIIADNTHALTQLTTEAVTHPEGYVLQVTTNGIIIAGADERGTFYAIQSLKQLLTDTPELNAVRIRDYPELAWRVAMIYLDNDSDAVNGKLIPLLAEHKFNALLIMSDYVLWDSAPNLHVPTAATKDAARNVAALARANLMEPIPLLETLGHTQWMFTNNQNRDLLQDPTVNTPFAYDPLNPRTYEVLLPIIDELIEVFNPAYFHIGHDEVRNVIPFPASDAGKAVGFAELFIQDTLKLHAHLAAQGVRTLMWQDVLLSAEITPHLNRLPQDLMITSWNYIPAQRYEDVLTLQNAGFDVLGASWYNPDNISSYARFAADTQTPGMIQTRWTGYAGNASATSSQYQQMYAYLTAANAFWNPDAPTLNNPAVRFRQAWQDAPTQTNTAGYTLNLSPYANQPLTQGIYGLESDYALSELLTQERLAGVRFALGDGVALRGTHRRSVDYPEQVRFVINQGASRVVFAHTTGWSVPAATNVMTYIITYADGTQEHVPVQYAQDINTWTTTEITDMNLLQAWQGVTPNGLPAAVSLMIWNNPRPDTLISSITAQSASTLASPVVLGVTLLE